MKNIYVAILVALAIIFACTENKAPERRGIEKLSFTVNKSLLGAEYKDRDLGFLFSPPVGWEIMPQETINQAREKLEQLAVPVSNVKVDLRQFFLDRNTGASCVLSKLTGVSSDSLGMKKLDSYVAAAIAKFPLNTVKQGLFVHKDLLVHQTLVMSENMVTFKLVFPRSIENSFQLDYVIPSTVYEEKMEAIESSIGSVISLE